MEAINRNLEGHPNGKNLGESVRKISDAATELASQTLESVRHTGEKAAESLQEQGTEYVRKAEEVIKNDPLRSSLVALGIGFLLGRFLSRS